MYYWNAKGIQKNAADGGGVEELLLKVGGGEFPTSASPDGKVLLYGNADIRKLWLTGERRSEAYLETEYSDGFAVFSPDGRWVAYQ